MRQLRLVVAAGILGGLLGSASSADEIKKSPLGTSIKKIAQPSDDCPDGSCGKFGTSVQFVSTPSEAAKQAAKEEKLVLVLHVSGNFENPDFT